MSIQIVRRFTGEVIREVDAETLVSANLRLANLRYANLEGAKLCWSSHELISEILRQRAGADPDKRKIAGLIAVSLDWFWNEFLALNDPLMDWALEVLSEWAKDDEDAPDCVRAKLKAKRLPRPRKANASAERA